MLARGQTPRSHDEGRWLWVPAFAGTTTRRASLRTSSLPSLPRRDDLDLIAAFQPRFGPAAFRHHVVIQGYREMRALIVEFAEQRSDACRENFARLAVDGHAHRITSLSIWPRST